MIHTCILGISEPEYQAYQFARKRFQVRFRDFFINISRLVQLLLDKLSNLFLSGDTSEID